eukprot:SAG31_NODE_7681_length_1618_cov_1.584595_2_plen_75_part_00
MPTGGIKPPLRLRSRAIHVVEHRMVVVVGIHIHELHAGGHMAAHSAAIDLQCSSNRAEGRSHLVLGTGCAEVRK